MSYPPPFQDPVPGSSGQTPPDQSSYPPPPYQPGSMPIQQPPPYGVPSQPAYPPYQTGSVPPQQPPSYGAPPPDYPQPPPYGVPVQPGYPPAYPQSGYIMPGYVQPMMVAVAPPNNPLALTSMILGIVGIVLIWLYGIGLLAAITAVILGHIGLVQIKNSAGTQGGNGMAIAGLVLGYIVAVPAVLCLLLLFLGAIGGVFFLPNFVPTPTPIPSF
jgi:hypothetical protein